ncbi:MAG: 16S rRNA-dimethyltransferase [Candidatus Tokpelaia sp. JSC161]|jgi:16S rRNA (adenine1518-N6/adenine1519-N6)-dimethyltransferase|nr:MAG: 16S rRNA-dimethyltransferase [Candidatus Tokpelaia sp. JSC161]
MEIDKLPPLRIVIQSQRLTAKKSLGQNFLFDFNLTTKIARHAGDLKNKQVIEIGPGPGGLTRALLKQGAFVIAIEKDNRFITPLKDIASLYPPGRLQIISENALQFNFTSFFKKTRQKPKIVANLPYNTGTKLLLKWLLTEVWPPFYESMTLMFQREVAKRIVAKPGSAAYGRLGVLSGWRTESRILFDIPSQAFTPPPKVISSLVQIVPREKPLPCSIKGIEKITKVAFHQRRKMLRQSLKSLGGTTLLNKAEINGERRAETLSINEFVTLATIINHS